MTQVAVRLFSDGKLLTIRPSETIFQRFGLRYPNETRLPVPEYFSDGIRRARTRSEPLFARVQT
ncbi:hypothetical protein [Neisseria sp. CCUG12390]|uniref:hypothetical protein n=1 Tax=Neisseria sp. CCUG12390 TaxID=3392035 RepID=UPI003A0FCCDA